MRIDWLPVSLKGLSRKSFGWLSREPKMRQRRTQFVNSLESLECRTLMAGDGLLGGLLPLGLPDTFTGQQDTPLTSVVSVLNNDTGLLGGVLNAVLGSGPQHGVLTLLSDGTFTYIPDLGFIGTDTFTYFTNQGLLGSLLPSLVTLDILPANRPPVANNDVFTVSEDSVLNISLGTALNGVLANDTDPDLLGLPDILGLGDVVLTASLVSGPSHGSLVFLPTGTFIYTPDPDFTGVDTFTYQASDLLSLSNVATVSINVTAENDAPVSLPDNYSTAINTPLTVNAGSGVLANDIDIDSVNITASVVTGPTNGSVVLNADGSFTYTPANNFNGVDSFTYLASDGTTPGNLATVTIAVTGTPNSTPVATADTYLLTEDTPFTTTLLNGVLANDTDADSDALTAAMIIGPSNGTITFNANGTFSYTPNANFNGTDTFTYQTSDGKSNSNIATVTLTIAAVNDAPVSVADAYSTDKNTTLTVAGPGVLANDSDPEGSQITAAQVGLPSHGNLTLNPDGSFVYIPDSNYSGPDSFTYLANDGTVDGNLVTVTITVNATNAAPVAVADTYNVNEDSVLSIGALSGVLANDTDADGDDLTAVLVTAPENGSLTLNADGSFVYTPNVDFNGVDGFVYRANDGTIIGSAVLVTINVASQPEAPVVTTSAGEKTVKGNKKTVIDAAINLTDVDSPNFGSGRLDIAISSGAGSLDQIRFRKGGANKGVVNAKRGQIRVGRVIIGTITGGRNGTPVHIELNSNATQERVEAVLQQAIFRGKKSQAGTRTIQFSTTDDTGLVSNLATKTIGVV